MRPSASMRSRKGLRVTLSALSMLSPRARSLSRALLSAALGPGGRLYAGRDGGETGRGVARINSRVFTSEKNYGHRQAMPMGFFGEMEQ
jgi:hypothetical protein